MRKLSSMQFYQLGYKSARFRHNMYRLSQRGARAMSARQLRRWAHWERELNRLGRHLL